MKKVFTTAVSALAILVLGIGSAFAQDDAAEEPDWRPVETFTCNYLDGKGRADLDEVIEEWNDWWDDKGMNSYFGATITPYYFGELRFELGWLGAWTDGAVMGSSLDTWTTEGVGMNAKFFEVLDCGSHSSFASINVRQPDNDDDDDGSDTFILNFSNCSFEEDKTLGDYLAAQNEWNDYADEVGIVGGTWVMFPLAGEANDDYDFKLVSSEPDHTTVGTNFDIYAQGHYRKSNELFNDLLDCDSTRVYKAHVERSMESEDD
jgi:hypothetical protein